MTDLTFEHDPHPCPVPAAERARLLADPGFGRVFTDHMVTIRYAEGRGWHDARVRPHGPLSLSPAAAVLHYAQEIFEGLKAYCLPGGDAALFRPDANARRFRRSAERLAMAPLPDDLFLRSLAELVRRDADWIPDAEDGTLYLRPFMVASEAFLGVRPASEYLYVVIASPVGGYFRNGPTPLSVGVSDRMVRAAPGGTGSAKCGGNYAASLLPHAGATAAGCDQVMFLDAAEHRWIEELGGMNLFFVFDDGAVRTPPLLDTVLAGVTRDSVLTLLRARGVDVREEPYPIDGLRADAASGRLVEAFACGTAAVIAPIGLVRGPGYDARISGGATGALTAALRDELVGIQRGVAPDPHGWLVRV